MIRASIIIGGLLLVSPPTWAEGLPVEPGMWEMVSTVHMPMMPEPRTETTTECVEKSEISMEDMGTEDMDPGCTFEQQLLEANTMKWSFDCPVEGGTSHGEWEATSSGDTVIGEGVITVSFQGQSMEMTMNWEGKRVGDCSM